ncbi:MAG TPA: hypothetical protein PLU02_01450 [Chitinophagales bacterium]|nr:hypothetical protein [Chitinophagales bacterium]
MTQKSYPVTNYRLILLIIGITGLLMRGFLGETDVVTIILFIIQLVALDLILKESNIFSTVYYRFIQICISIYIIGALFIIMHWEGGSLLLTAAVSGVVVTYIIRTINKSPINILDIVKCAWVISVCFTTIAKLMHLRYADIGNYINLGLFGVMLLLFFLSPVKPAPKHNNSHNELPLDQVD